MGAAVAGPGGAVRGEDGLPRCPWATSSELMRDYHDLEWGRPVPGEAALFERLTLEAFQSGLSWATILRKRPAFREAFCSFDVDTVAGFDEEDLARLMGDAAIVRNRAKIVAAVTNARATQELRDSGGLGALVAQFAPHRQPVPRSAAEVPTVSPESRALSAALKHAGFSFVGPTTMHALMEATGMINTHLVGCHRRRPD